MRTICIVVSIPRKWEAICDNGLLRLLRPPQGMTILIRPWIFNPIAHRKGSDTKPLRLIITADASIFRLRFCIIDNQPKNWDRTVLRPVLSQCLALILILHLRLRFQLRLRFVFDRKLWQEIIRPLIKFHRNFIALRGVNYFGDSIFEAINEERQTMCLSFDND